MTPANDNKMRRARILSWILSGGAAGVLAGVLVTLFGK